MNAIEVSHLTKHFGKLVALHDISFSVKEGETFGSPALTAQARPRPPGS